eukprot:COSAG01_NODE_24_length_37608_cov_19.303154_25_plen_254_part_00
MARAIMAPQTPPTRAQKRKPRTRIPPRLLVAPPRRGLEPGPCLLLGWSIPNAIVPNAIVPNAIVPSGRPCHHPPPQPLLCAARRRQDRGARGEVQPCAQRPWKRSQPSAWRLCFVCFCVFCSSGGWALSLTERKGGGGGGGDLRSDTHTHTHFPSRWHSPAWSDTLRRAQSRMASHCPACPAAVSTLNFWIGTGVTCANLSQNRPRITWKRPARRHVGRQVGERPAPVRPARVQTAVLGSEPASVTEIPLRFC